MPASLHLVGEFGFFDVHHADVVCEFITVLERVVFGFAIGVVEADGQRDGLVSNGGVVPSADARQEMNRLGLAVARDGYLFRHLATDCAVRAVE